MEEKRKKCSSCKRFKRGSLFSKDPTKKDGLNDKCKNCFSKYRSKHYKKWKPKYSLTKTKICKSCGKELPLTKSFWKIGNYGRDGLSNSCERCRRLLIYYGATSEEIDSLYSKQKGNCAICQRPHPLRWLHVDHDHKIYEKKRDGRGTVKQRRRSVRGLLCSPCNKSLGWYEIVNLFLPSQWEVAREYLTNPPAKGILWE